MPDCVTLVRYRTCSGIISFFQSGTGLTGCQRSGIPAFLYICTWTLTWTCSIDMDMQHGHGHALWIWTCSMGMDTQYSFDNAACIWTMDMHGCRNADKKFSPASLVFRQFTTLSPASAFRHHGQSGTASHGPVHQCPAMDWRSKETETYKCASRAAYLIQLSRILLSGVKWELRSGPGLQCMKNYLMKTKETDNLVILYL